MEAPSPCRRLIDWAVRKREMSFTMGREGQQARDTRSLSSENFAFCWSNPPCWHQRTTADVGMNFTGNASVKRDGCKWSRFIAPPAFDWAFFILIRKCKALASECFFSLKNSNREEAAEQVLDMRCTVGWISKIMPVHISYPFYNLSPPDLAKCIALQIPVLPFIFTTGGGQSLCSLKKKKITIHEQTSSEISKTCIISHVICDN